MQRYIAARAADLGSFFPLLDHLGECIEFDWNEPSQFRQFVNTGRAWYDAMIRVVHGESSCGGALPLPSELYRWQQTATSLTKLLATIDPQWYIEYWSRVFDSGHPVPQHPKRKVRPPASSDDSWRRPKRVDENGPGRADARGRHRERGEGGADRGWSVTGVVSALLPVTSPAYEATL
jgi:hypothetical protein